MSPLHAALVAAVGSDGISAVGEEGGGWSDITAAVLVELPVNLTPYYIKGVGCRV
jgi:NAD(P)H-dependent flavin oxidoreductase YrpB (nitropropane dioxygenase family)